MFTTLPQGVGFPLFAPRQLSCLQVLFAVVVVVTLRHFLELALLSYDYLLADRFQDEVRFFLENLIYFLVLFWALVYAVSKLAKRPVLAVASFGARFSGIILLPPIIDRIAGRVAGYPYGSVSKFFENLLTFSLAEISPGIATAVFLATLASGLYVWHFRRSVTRALAAAAGTEIFIITLSTPDLFLGSGGGSIIHDYFLPLYYGLPLLALAFVFGREWGGEKLRVILGNFRPLRAAMFVLAVLLGAIASPEPVSLFSILVVLSVFFSWESAVAWNDIGDAAIDRESNPDRPIPRGTVASGEYAIVGVVFAFFALAFSAMTYASVFVFALIGVALGVFYSLPPFRLRRTLIGNLVIGAFLWLSFATGVLSTGAGWDAVASGNVLHFGVFSFILGTIVTLTKDLKDIRADAAHGVRNLYTIFGPQWGRALTSALLFAALNTSAFLFRAWHLLFISVPAGALAVYLYHRTGNEQIAYLMAAAIAISTFLMIWPG